MSTYLDGVADVLRGGVPPSDDPVDWSAPPPAVADALPGGARILLVTPGFVESRHVVGLVLDRKGRLRSVLKVPRSVRDDHAVVHEATVLRRLAEAAPALIGTTPSVVACATVGSRRVLLETPLVGQPLTHARARSDAGARTAALAWIEGLPVTGERSGSDLLDTLLEPRLERLAAMLPADHALHGTIEATRAAVLPLRGRTLPTVFEHGDPAHPNILVLDGGAGTRVGLVDWELGLERGVVGYDLAQLLAFLAFSDASVHGVEAEREVFVRELVRPDGAARMVFAEHVARRADADLEPALFVLAWARAGLRILDRVALAADSGTDELLAEVEVSRNVALWQEAAAPRG